MLRGINRSIIEINETGNRYFERVLVFVRPEFGQFSKSKLEDEAVKLINSMASPPVGLKPKSKITARAMSVRRKRNSIAIGVLGVLVIAALLIIFLM